MCRFDLDQAEVGANRQPHARFKGKEPMSDAQITTRVHEAAAGAVLKAGVTDARCSFPGLRRSREPDRPGPKFQMVPYDVNFDFTSISLTLREASVQTI